jgi:D-alanine-D-alanine ligase
VVHNRDFSGGVSADLALDERARSDVLAVADGVCDALQHRGMVVSRYAVCSRDILHTVATIAEAGVDCVFNLVESLDGRSEHEAVLPTLLDLYGIPYTGSSALALNSAFRKEVTKALLSSAELPTPRGCLLASPEDIAKLDAVVGRFRHFPAMVKPAHEDASTGITVDSVAADEGTLRRRVVALADAARVPGSPSVGFFPLLIEEYIPGRELNVSLLGPEPRVLPLHEIDFSAVPAGRPPIVTYAAKWDESSEDYKSTPSVAVVGLSDELRQRVERTARAAFQLLGLRDYGRVDLRVAEDGTPYVIDVNPNCALAPDAGFARAALAAGLPYDAMIQQLVELALQRSP